MDYQTLISDAASWMFSDLSNSIWIIGGIAIIGAMVGIGRSFGWCKYTKHSGLRVL